MPEMIDRATVLKYLTPRIKAETPYVEGYNRALEDAAELVTLMPTIEQEVRHGKWIAQEDSDGDISFVCNNCRRRLRFDENYCPTCGVDMREECINNE